MLVGYHVLRRFHREITAYFCRFSGVSACHAYRHEYLLSLHAAMSEPLASPSLFACILIFFQWRPSCKDYKGHPEQLLICHHFVIPDLAEEADKPKIPCRPKNPTCVQCVNGHALSRPQRSGDTRTISHSSSTMPPSCPFINGRLLTPSNFPRKTGWSGGRWYTSSTGIETCVQHDTGYDRALSPRVTVVNLPSIYEMCLTTGITLNAYCSTCR